MNVVTGIELGPDYCVLVQARLRANTIVCGPVRVFGPGRWPAQRAARVELLSEARRQLSLSTRAWVVQWWLDSPTAQSSTTLPPETDGMVEEAGFQSEASLTPSQALALLGGSRETSERDGEASLVTCR